MPKYFEFVFSAYAFWVVTFGLYFAHLVHRSRRAARALARLGEGARASGSEDKA